MQSEPARVPETMSEFFALARAMEETAARRYVEFATLMRGRGRDDIADAFEKIADEERGHARNVTAWEAARLEGSHATQPPFPAPPAFREDDEAEIVDSNLMTPYRALSIAVRNEERAFVFWSYVAANSDRREIKSASERMASEELQHVVTFRRLRREAYHAARRAVLTVTLPAAQAERRLAADLRSSADAGAPDDAARLRRIAEQSLELAELADARPSLVIAAQQGEPPRALAEALADAYVGAMEQARSESDIASLHRLATGAIARIAALRSTAAS